MSSEDAAIRGSNGLDADEELDRARHTGGLGPAGQAVADLYRRAIDALSERPLKRGSLVIAGRCIRDLVNGLPDVLTDVDSLPAYSDMTTPTRELSQVWAQHEDVLGSVDTDGNQASDVNRDSDPRMTVPTVVVRAARSVVVASLAGDLNARRRHSALVLGRSEVRQDPTVKVFRDSVRIFERLRHPQRGREITVTAETLPKLLRALEIIEGALEGRMGNFFATVEDLMDLLDAANERDGVDGQ